jgi:hypothetical protein
VDGPHHRGRTSAALGARADQARAAGEPLTEVLHLDHPHQGRRGADARHRGPGVRGIEKGG